MATDATALMIESVFLAKLLASELYGDPVEGLAQSLKERVPNGMTEADLLSAAESVILSHGSGAFPKLPACLRAIEEAHSRFASSPTRGSVWRAGVVTKESYEQAALAFCASRYPKGKIPVIDRIAQPKEWDEWQRYYADIGMKASARMMLDGRNKWTVPSMWPVEFDPSAVKLSVESLSSIGYRGQV
jgi:hypothetical protein